MNRITVTRDPNPLVRWEWTFWYDDSRHALILDWYATLERPSKRHKFTITETYKRTMARDSRLKESDVLMCPDVIAEAQKQFCDSLRVMRWSEK